MQKMIVLDGASGEGGGQILRSALSLAMLTGQAFRIENIRAGRSKPGLLRQHLIAVQAAAKVCGADVSTCKLGDAKLEFIPGALRAGNYEFAIGSAGSCTLVLQTLILPLLFADGPSEIVITGGTHNGMAPPAQYLQKVYARLLREMGAKLEIELERYGFYPAGGGRLRVKIEAIKSLRPLHLLEKGERLKAYAEAFMAGIPGHVAKRELDTIQAAFSWNDEQLFFRQLPEGQGPGNALLLSMEHEHVTEIFSAVGEKSLSAEQVARNVIEQAQQYLASDAAVGEHLADQLLLPLAVAGSGSFSASNLSLHTRTNAEVIARFLPLEFLFSRESRRFICELQPK